MEHTLMREIDRRKSIRKYLPIPVAHEKRLRMMELIGRYNETGGLSMQWVEDAAEAFKGLKSYGFFRNARSVIVLKGKANDPHLCEKLGYFGELLVLHATSLDLGSCFVAGTFDQKSRCFSVGNDETFVAVVTVGEVAGGIPKERAQRRRRKKPEQLYIAYETPEAWFLKGIDAVYQAPSAMNKQPVHFSYVDGAVRAAVDKETNATLLDLGIAKLHFEIAALGSFQLGNNASFAKDT